MLFCAGSGTAFFDYTLIILDTHFAEEYYQTDEGKLFPIHCEYGTKDWELTVDVSGLPHKHYVMKNNFNFWTDYQRSDIILPDLKRKTAHDSLFHVMDNLYEPTVMIPRDTFFQMISQEGDPANIEVTLIGVASDYCNRYAMEGWLEKGARVTIIEDLTKGITKETEQVLGEKEYRKYLGNRLRAVTSTDYLMELLNS